MSRTYKATGINLKAVPLGESDRLVTILTQEYGLVRVVAMGARKPSSHLGGRSGLFVVNHLLIAKGRSLDKLTQAETLASFPKLAQDLGKLAAAHYLAELVLCQALSDQPQEELFFLLREQLHQLEQADRVEILPLLTRSVFQLLVTAGIAPQVHRCCLTQQPITPNFSEPSWRIGFSIPAGGICTLSALEGLRQKAPANSPSSKQEGINSLGSQSHHHPPVTSLHRTITATQLAFLQALTQAEPSQGENSQNLGRNFLTKPSTLENEWLSVERILRQYANYHFDRSIRSAALIDTCFPS